MELDLPEIGEENMQQGHVVDAWMMQSREVGQTGILYQTGQLNRGLRFTGK